MNDMGANLIRQKVGESRRLSEKRALKTVSLSTIILLLCTTLSMTISNQNVSARMWEPIQEISTDSTTERQWNVSLAAEDDKVYAVWADFEDGDYDIYYRYNDGASWLGEWEISTDTSGEWQINPSISVENGKLYVVWEQVNSTTRDIYYRHFDGTTWQPEMLLSTDIGWERQEAPDVAVDNGQVHVVWQDDYDGDWDVFYRHFDGTSWQPEQQISPDPWLEVHKNPSIAAEGGGIHVVWENISSGNFGIRYKHFNGLGWQPEVELSTDFIWDKSFPSVAVSGGNVHVVWGDRKSDGDYDIFYRHFDGVSWQPDQEISVDAGSELQFAPAIALDSAEVHVVWWEGGVGDNITYRYCDGVSWQPEEVIATFSGISWYGEYPVVSSAPGVVHVAWADSRDGDYDIMYTRSTEDITPPQSNTNPISPYWQTTTTFDVDWTATDDQDLANISLYYRFSPNNASWFPWAEWDYNNSTSGVFATGTFPFDAIDGDGFYEFYTIARDSSGNNEMPPLSADSIVGVDTDPPTGSIVINDGDEWTTSTSVTLTLTYFDALSGVDQVRYSNDGLWDSEPWETPSSTKAWIIPSGDGTKTVYYQVRDNAGLLSTTYSDDISLDTTPPVGSIIINDGDIWTTSPWVTLSLTYFDATSGVDQVRYSNDGVWDSESWEFPSTTKEWPLSFGDGVKTVYYQIKDNAGLLSNTYSDSIGLDTTEPVGFITVNNGDEWTNSTSVILTLGYLDSTSGVSQVRYSNDGLWDSEVWETPSTTKSWTITSGDEIKIIHYQIRDVAGLESMTYLDYIGLDTTQPTGSVNVNNGDELTASTSVTLSLAYWDSFSGVAKIRFSNDGIWDTEVWQSPSTEKPWLLTSGDGTKTVYYQIRDNAGLISETYTDDIELDTTPPTIVSISPPNGVTGVEISTNIEVTFSERMDQSATVDSFSLVKGQTEIDGMIVWTIDGRTMFFIPTGDLEYNTTYQIFILTGARDIAGNSMVGASDTSFTTKEVEEETQEEPLTTTDYWWIILVLVIILLIIALIVVGRRKRSQTEEVPTDEENGLESSEANQSNDVNET